VLVVGLSCKRKRPEIPYCMSKRTVRLLLNTTLARCRCRRLLSVCMEVKLLKYSMKQPSQLVIADLPQRHDQHHPMIVEEWFGARPFPVKRQARGADEV